MPRSARHARTVLALAVLFSVAGIVGFALTPPAGPWWWTGAFVDGQLGLITIWAALGSAPWYLRWPCWFTALTLTGLQVSSWDPSSLHLRWLAMSHALFTFTLLCLLREFGVQMEREGAPSRKTVSLGQFTLRRMFALVAIAALAMWAWQHRRELLPNRGRLPDLLEIGDCVCLSAIDLIAVWTVLRSSSIRWRRIWLVAAVLLAQTALWRDGRRGGPWWYEIPPVCIYDLFYLAPIIGGLAAYRWTMSNQGGSTPSESHAQETRAESSIA